MHSSYQMNETHLADLSLTVHDRINDLHRRADALARKVADSALDSGCTDMTAKSYAALGPRQRKAWDLVAEAHSWNAISDNPASLGQAEQAERDGIAYHIEYGSEGWPVVLDAKPEPLETKTVDTSQLEIGDIVRTHGMLVRINSVRKYTADGGGTAWSCPGTVLNSDEVRAAGTVPMGFLECSIHPGGRCWHVQGNTLARWTVVIPSPGGHCGNDNPHMPHSNLGTLCPGTTLDEHAAGEDQHEAAQVHVRTPGRAWDQEGRHAKPGQWLSVIHEANRISPEMFGQPESQSMQAQGWTEEYPDARVIHRTDETVSVISKTAHGSEVLAEAARRLGLSPADPEPKREEATAWPDGKKFGELTPAQKQAAIRRAGAQLSAELTANAEAIGEVLASADQILAGEAGEVAGVPFGPQDEGSAAARAQVASAVAGIKARALEATGEYIQLSPEAVEKFALAREVADAMERRDQERRLNAADMHGDEVLVIRSYDDAPCPVVGSVTRWEDEEWVWVLWPGAAESVREALDQLSPYRH